MKVGFIPNLNKENVYEVLKEATEVCQRQGMEVYMPSDVTNLEKLKTELSIPDSHYMERSRLFETIDMAFSFGGDGTLIQLAKEIYTYSKPICGVNLGELGFLNQIEQHNIEASICRLAAGAYEIEDRILLSSYIMGRNGRINLMPAINDVVISRSEPGKMARIRLAINGIDTQQYPADGLIVATATGSTSYNLSGGGPILSPENHSIVVTPVCPHLVQNVSLVLPEDAKLCITMPEREKDLYVSVDGTYDYVLHNDETLYVSADPLYTRFVRFTNQHFFASLFKKLSARREALL